MQLEFFNKYINVYYVQNSFC